MDVERDGDRFSVTLYHDDSGEEGYANWWQVEDIKGNVLGRRKLLHAHGTRNFTRSESIDVPGDVEKIVVRGHDQVHGYGGRAVLFDLENGGKELVEQGSTRKDITSKSTGNESTDESDEVSRTVEEGVSMNSEADSDGENKLSALFSALLGMFGL